MQERFPRLQGGGVGHQGEVVGFLDRVGGQHGPAGAAGVHDVGMVTEYGQGVGGEGARRHVYDRRSELAGDLEHVGHH